MLIKTQAKKYFFICFVLFTTSFFKNLNAFVFLIAKHWIFSLIFQVLYIFNFFSCFAFNIFFVLFCFAFHLYPGTSDFDQKHSI